MVWAGGITTITKGIQNLSVEVEQTNFDADAEVGDVVDVMQSLNNYPTDGYVYAYQTAGTTDTVSVILEASVDNNTWDTLATAINADAVNYIPVHITSTTKLYRYFRITITTVGTGNTLTVVFVVGYRR